MSRVVRSVDFVSAQGWPLISSLAIWHDRTRDGIAGPDSWQISGWSGIQIDLRREAWGPSKALPLRPIWPGFVIDTLFYGAIWGGVWFGFVGAKRGIRLRRGRCPMCGYDLRGHRHEGTEAQRHEGLVAGCPECGWGRELAS